jgi:hypothetical protein
MKTDNLEKYLDSFGKYIVQQSKSNLTKAKKNVDKTLYNSIKFKVVRDKVGFTVQFFMEDYGTFVDKGVSGNKKNRSYKNYQGKTVKTDYKYTTKGPPIDILSKWIKKRGIKPKGTGRGRSKITGQYISGLAYFISAKIKSQGIKGISFFQRPLQLGMKKFSEKILNSLKQDILNNLDDSTEGLTTVK